MIIARYALAAISICLAAGFFAASSQLPVMGIGDPVGPSAFPMLISGALAVCGLLLALEARHKTKREMGEKVPASKTRADLGDLPLVLGASLWTGLYFLAFEQIGYISATFIFLFGGIVAFRRSRLVVSLIVAAGCSLGFYCVFVILLGAQLPIGNLFE